MENICGYVAVNHKNNFFLVASSAQFWPLISKQSRMISLVILSQVTEVAIFVSRVDYKKISPYEWAKKNFPPVPLYFAIYYSIFVHFRLFLLHRNIQKGRIKIMNQTSAYFIVCFIIVQRKILLINSICLPNL